MQQLRPRRLAAAVLVVGGTLLTPHVARAQTGKIAGVVTDAQTGQPIEGVQVAVQGTGYGAITQANGRYFIIAVPPGTYSVVARRIGYQGTQVAGVQVAIDVTRELNFRLNSAATTLVTQQIVAEAAPLVERGLTGSSTTITTEQIQALPVTNISGILALQQGFVDVPQNTQLMALSEEQRSTVAPIRVRGGRGGATVTLIDGIPVNNPLLGTVSVNLNALAVSAVDFVRGYMEPQYGNGLSGVINQAVREGGADIAGSVDYQTSAVAGALGSRQDDLNGYHLLRGYLSGPVPGTATKLRYLVSGQIESGAARVLKFDEDVTSFDRQQDFGGRLPPQTLDLIPGWRAFGGRTNQQIVGKLTFLPVASNKLNLTVIDQQRQTVPYDRRFLLANIGDPWQYARNIMDSLGLQGQRLIRDVVPYGVRDQARVYAGYFEQRFGRSLLQVRASQTEFERNSCNIWLGVCVPSPFVRPGFAEQFYVPITGVLNLGVPLVGTDNLYGGETYTTRTVRGDIQSQVTDHHNIQFGGSFLQHDIGYLERRGVGRESGVQSEVLQLYRAKPVEAAAYAQDRIEYDFLTVKLGARYDYGRAQGRGFRDPLNPTAGTTAREVCTGRASSLGATTPYTRQIPSKTAAGLDTMVTVSGLEACLFQDVPGVRSALMDSAVRVAQRDDFKTADPRKAFSPRIGISFPLTERSTVFFNAGRYTMNPLYANLYRNTGIGVRAGSADRFCEANQTKPGTNECVPPLSPGNPDFIGNPNLLLEQATQYEVGYGAEFARAYSVNVAVYNRDETGLSGLRSSLATQDIGTTYAGQALPRYTTIVNQDFLTSRGVEIQFRRRLQNRWSFDINYGWARTTTNSPPPERTQEIISGGEVDRSVLREIVSEIDQTHRFNGTLTYSVRRDPPSFRFGSLLRNSMATVTYSYQSGFPYTPQRALSLGGISDAVSDADLNAGRGPATQQVNLLVNKAFDVRNVRFSAFVRVDNLFDRRNCVQVFVSTGTCESGLRDPINRRVGNFDETTSTNFDQPEYIGVRRTINSGLAVTF